jgi:regulator of sirC expression with transglutaminase-like and TPR domain
LEKISDSEFKALISLLDDPDEEVIMHVSAKLMELGIKGVEQLEKAWETASDVLQQSRIENLIQDIQFQKLKSELTQWKNQDSHDLLLGAILVAKFRYPELDESVIYSAIDKLVQAIWLELHNGLTPLEEVHVINNVLYKLSGFIGEQEAFKDPNLAYINRVLEIRKGNSNSLGILYLILCNELNIPVYGIDLPYYFILAYVSGQYDRETAHLVSREHISFYINPVNEGIVFQHKQIDDYLQQMNVAPKNKHFVPCSNISVISALLRNLALCHEQKGDLDAAVKLRELIVLLKEVSV